MAGAGIRRLRAGIRGNAIKSLSGVGARPEPAMHKERKGGR